MFLVDGVTYFQRRRRRTKERRGMREEEMNNKKDEWSGEEWVDVEGARAHFHFHRIGGAR